jgi:hypothetical protein
MPEITHPTTALSLILTPAIDAQRDELTLSQRINRLDNTLERIRTQALSWAAHRAPDEHFVEFEEKMLAALQQAGREASEVMLASAEAKSRREHPAQSTIGETSYRLSRPEPRSLDSWFGVIRYRRSYARPTSGGAGYFPLDVELGLLADRFSPSLLTTGARLATRMSFAEAHEVMGWFVPTPPSTSVLEQTVLGLGHHTEAWFEQAPLPEGDGEVLVVLIDGKCVPTARESELEKRRGKREGKPAAPSPRHRGRADRKAGGRRPRRKKGDKSKNGKLVTMVVTYTLKRQGDLLLGPINRRVYASFGPKRHAFEYARREAERRGFGPGTERTVQLLTDGDPDLHLYTDEYFGEAEYPNRVVTVDVIHVLEKLWDAGRSRYKEGSPELAAWVWKQEGRLYTDNAAAVVDELRVWLEETPKTGPGNKGKRKRISDAIRYLDQRLDKLSYGSCRERDLEVGTGQVEGAIKYVIAKRCDHGGMRWIRERAQAVIQLRCIDVNGHWKKFVAWAMDRLRRSEHTAGRRARLQTKTPAKLPSLRLAA